MNRQSSTILLFLKKVQNLPKHAILEEIEKEFQTTSNFIRENKHSYESREFKEKMKYYRHLKSFKHLLINEEKDMLLRDKEYKKFEWICEKLIIRGEISGDIRSIFI